jgi:hypothetical protein
MKSIKPSFKSSIVLLFGVSFFSNAVSSQEPVKGIINADTKPFYTDMHIKKKEKAGVFMYNHIIVKDCRPDTLKMGYVKLDSKAKPQRIVFPKEGERYIGELFNEAIQPLQGLDTLVVIINDIWFNETRTTATAVHKHVFGPEKLVSSCYINANFFAKKEGKYIPIGSYDSVSSKKGEWLPNNCDKLLEKAITSLALTADLHWSHIDSISAVYTIEQLDSLVSSKFDYAILKADKPAKGVYFTYKDFLNNAPSSIEFTVISEVRNSIRYAGMGKENLSWGYCDGENVFMHIDKGFYLLNRTGNTFEVVGPAVVEYVNTFLDKVIDVAGSYYLAGFFNFEAIAKPSEVSIEYYKFYRLNMKKGILY